MAVRSAINGLSICTGIGGIDLGLGLVLGDAYRTVCMVEREAYAAAILVARMEDLSLAPAPIWDNITTFDGNPWRGIVDVIHAGAPCQPFSVAGKQQRTADARWIWPDIYRVVCEVQPRLVFLEEVRGFLRGGLGLVLRDLADAGYRYTYDIFSAAEVGASHKRERLFLLADRNGSGQLWSAQQDSETNESQVKLSPWDNAFRRDSHVADARRFGDERWRECREFSEATDEIESSTQEWQWHGDATGNGGTDVADADGFGRAETRRRQSQGLRSSSSSKSVDCGPLGDFAHKYRAEQSQVNDRESPMVGTFARTDGRIESRRTAEGIQQQIGIDATSSEDIRLFPPGPTDRDAWAKIITERPDLAPATESLIRGVVAGIPTGLDTDRTHKLRALGNAVVPLCAAYAFARLAERLGLTQDLGI